MWRWKQFRQKCRRALSRIPGVFVWQHGWRVGKYGLFTFSVERRMRALPFRVEHDRGPGRVSFGVTWASPTRHVWWARCISIHAQKPYRKKVM